MLPPGYASFPATDPMLIICPLLLAFMPGRMACVRNTRPLTLVSNMVSNASSVTSDKWSRPITRPALFTKMSMSFFWGNLEIAVSMFFFWRTSRDKVSTVMSLCCCKSSFFNASNLSDLRAAKIWFAEKKKYRATLIDPWECLFCARNSPNLSLVWRILWRKLRQYRQMLLCYIVLDVHSMSRRHGFFCCLH